MKIGFFGTPDFARAILSDLSDAPDTEVVFAVTNPDAPVGRSGELRESPVKAFAKSRGIPVFDPLKIRGNAEFLETVRSFRADYFVVAAYGKILPKEILDAPLRRCVNVHGSVLPEYRGASPVQSAIRDGKTETGVTIMEMSEGMDEGDILGIDRFPIRDGETAASLFETFSKRSGTFLLDVLRRDTEGGVVPITQDASRATYCSKISKESGRIDWNSSAESIGRTLRAYSPWPGIFSSYGEKRLVVESCGILPESECPPGLPPGRVFRHSAETCVRCGTGALILKRVKIE